jgi:hypothetical protein
MADFDEPALEPHPGERRSGASLARPRRVIGRFQRVHREDVLHVHQDQLLMLLLVMESELDERRQRRIALLQKARHRRIDVTAIGGDLGAARARE